MHILVNKLDLAPGGSGFGTKLRDLTKNYKTIIHIGLRRKSYK